jgi:predicted negative regulator of RcsB-dependent stress response
MARHPTARRTHHEHTSDDDVFVEKVLETSVWARDHRTPLTIVAVVAIIVLAAAWYYRTYRQRIADTAAIEILQVRQTAQSGNPALTIRDAEAFIGRFGSIPAGIEAQLILGQAYLESNQPQQAIDAVARLAGDLDSPAGVSAAMLTASAHEAATRFDQAEQILLRVASGARYDYQKVTALDNAARVRLERGNPTGAAELYGRILDLLPPGSQDRAVYEMRRAEALATASSAA